MLTDTPAYIRTVTSPGNQRRDLTELLQLWAEDLSCKTNASVWKDSALIVLSLWLKIFWTIKSKILILCLFTQSLLLRLLNILMLFARRHPSLMVVILILIFIWLFTNTYVNQPSQSTMMTDQQMKFFKYQQPNFDSRIGFQLEVQLGTNKITSGFSNEKLV